MSSLVAYGDTGFDPNNVLTMRMRLADARYPSPAQRSSFLATRASASATGVADGLE